MVKKINQSEFAQTKNDEVAIVDFSATWCGPCQMLAPIMEKLSDEYAGRVSFYNVDVDENPALAQQFGVVSIPFVAIFKKGEVIANQVGFVPEENFKKFIDSKI